MGCKKLARWMRFLPDPIRCLSLVPMSLQVCLITAVVCVKTGFDHRSEGFRPVVRKTYNTKLQNVNKYHTSIRSTKTFCGLDLLVFFFFSPGLFGQGTTDDDIIRIYKEALLNHEEEV